MKTIIKFIVFLAVAILFSLVSCVPKAIVVDPIAPHAARAKADVKAAADSSKRVKKSVETAHAQATGIVGEVNRATVEVERLKAQPTVAPDDFSALWQIMTELKTSSWAHEIKTRETVAETVEQGHLQDAAGKSLESLEATAIAHDKGVEALKTHLGKVEKQAASNGVYRTWVIVTAVSLGLLLVGWIALRVLKPSFLP